MYEKQNFYSGQKLKASQLDAMEDGIIEAQSNAINKPVEAPSEVMVPTVNTNNEVEYKELSSFGGGGSGGGTGLYKHSLMITLSAEDGSSFEGGAILISPESQPFTPSTIEEYYMNGLILSTMVDWLNPLPLLKVWIGDCYGTAYSFGDDAPGDFSYTDFIDTVTPV